MSHLLTKIAVLAEWRTLSDIYDLLYRVLINFLLMWVGTFYVLRRVTTVQAGITDPLVKETLCQFIEFESFYYDRN